jgi:hypothetical protein
MVLPAAFGDVTRVQDVPFQMPMYEVAGAGHRNTRPMAMHRVAEVH